jgi:hypothetical protein
VVAWGFGAIGIINTDTLTSARLNKMDLPYQEFTGTIREGHPNCYEYLDCMCQHAELIVSTVENDGIDSKRDIQEFLLVSGDFWVPDDDDFGAAGRTSGLVSEEYRVFFPKTGEDGDILRDENGEIIRSDVPDPEFEYWHGQDEETRSGLFESAMDPLPIQRMAAEMSGDMEDLQGLTGARWFTKMAATTALLAPDGETPIADLVHNAVESGKAYLINKELL